MSRILTILDEHPWLDGLPPAACWAWCRFYDHVARKGKPAGVVKQHTPARWAKTLGVESADVETMMHAALEVAAVRLRDDTFAVPALCRAEAVSPSTLRMRKKRARDRGEPPGRDGRPCFTASDAREVAKAFAAQGYKPPKAFVPACTKALNLTAGKVPDPMAHLLEAAGQFAEGAQATIPGLQTFSDPMVWLNQYVAGVCGWAAEGFDLLAPNADAPPTTS